MIIEKFLDYFFENCVSNGISLIKKHKINKLDRQIVEEYANRYFHQTFANLPLTEEFDFQPLQEFISQELDRSIALSFHLPYAFERKQMRESIYLNAYTCAGADSSEKKQIVCQYMNMLFSILENFYLDRTENMILSNHTVDEMNRILEKAQIELSETLESIQNKLVQITAKIEYRNSFMEMIDQIKPKTYNNVPFHYLNPSIRFYGREREMSELDEFREDDRQVLFCILTGSGGMGKSRLMFEYAKRHEYQIKWKFAFLTADQGKQLSLFHEFYFDKNLFLIIDYAGSQAQEISDCLYKLCQCTADCLPPKLRIVLIERQGVIYDDQGLEQMPYWLERVMGYQGLFDNVIKKCEMSWLQTLCGNNSELFQAVELLLIYSTATDRFSLEDTLPSYYQ